MRKRLFLDTAILRIVLCGLLIGQTTWATELYSLSGPAARLQGDLRRIADCRERRAADFTGMPDDELLSNESLRSSQAEKFCSVLHGVRTEEQVAQDCRYAGGSLLMRCGFLKLIDQRSLAELRAVPGADPAQKIARCQQRIEELASSSLLVSDCEFAVTPHRLTNSQVEVDRRGIVIASEATRPCAALESSSETGEGPAAPRLCSEFRDTPLAGTEFDTVFSRFVGGHTGFTNEALSLNPLNWGSKGACRSCFKAKYETAQALSGLEANDFGSRREQARKKAFADFAVRKLEEALSEYLKAVERQRFLGTVFGAPAQECEAIKRLDQQIASCVAGEHAAAVTREFRRRHGGGEGDSIGRLLSGAVDKYAAQIEAGAEARECGRSLPYGAYLSFLSSKIAADSFAPSKLVTRQLRTELQRCGDTDQRCLLEAIVRSRLGATAPESDAGRLIAQDVRSQFRHPFYRALLTHKQSLLAYGDSGDLTAARSFQDYHRENRDRFAALAQTDFDLSCAAVAGDLKLALCTRESDASQAYSGEGFRQALSDVLKTNPDPADRRAPGDNLIQLAVACELLNDGPAAEREKALHESRAAGDHVVDRGHIADVLLRFGGVKPASLSDKQEAYVSVFAEDSCRAELERRERDALALRLSQTYSRRTSATLFNYDGADTVRQQSMSFSLGTTSFFGASPATETAEISCGNGFINTGLSCARPSYSLDFGTSPGLRMSSSMVSRAPWASTELDVKLLGAGRSSASYYEQLRQQEQFMGPVWEPQTSDIPKQLESTAAVATRGADHFALTNTPESAVPRLGSEEGLMSGFLQGAGEVAGQIGVGRGPASVAAFGGGFGFSSTGQARDTGDVESVPRRASERHIEELEDRQSRLEQQLLGQARESTALADLRQQTQLEELRLELDRIRLSNQQLLQSLKGFEAKRQVRAPENLFDSSAEDDAEEVLDAPTREAQAAPRAPVRANSQLAPAARSERPVMGRSTFSEASAPVSSSAAVSSRAPSEASPVPVATASSGSAANVAVARGGAAAASASANRLVASAGATSFAPSQTLSRSIGGDPAVEALPQEKKVELLREFLSYVEAHPVHRDGRYLAEGNDQITVDYQGRMLVLRITDIPDPQVRSQLQERLLRQRLAINQTVRAARLESLRRLLASARAGN